MIFKRYLQFTQCYLFHFLSLHFLFAYVKTPTAQPAADFLLHLCSSRFSCSFIPFLLFPFPTPSSRSKDKSYGKEQRDKHQNKALVRQNILQVCLNSGNYRGFGGFFAHRLCQHLCTSFSVISYLLYEAASLGDLRTYCFSPRAVTLFCSVLLYSESDRLVNIFFHLNLFFTMKLCKRTYSFLKKN